MIKGLSHTCLNCYCDDFVLTCWTFLEMLFDELPRQFVEGFCLQVWFTQSFTHVTEKKQHVSEWRCCFIKGNFTRTVVPFHHQITCDSVSQFDFHTLLSFSCTFACTEMEYYESKRSLKHRFQKWKLTQAFIALAAAKMRSGDRM